MKSGIAISTYFGPQTNPNRMKIFMECVDSLSRSGFNGEIWLVDDASTTKKHLEYAKSRNIPIYERKENGGEGRVKNTSLNVLLNTKCDFLFISDDDMIFKPGWWLAYQAAMVKMDIPHMSYIVDGMKISNDIFLGVGISRALSPTTNGCFLPMMKEVPEKIGGWHVGNVKFGHLHENYSMRCLIYGIIPFYCDLQNKKQYVELSKMSNPIRSGKYNIKDADPNLPLLSNPRMWETITE